MVKKIDRLKEHVVDFVEFKLDQAGEDRTTYEKINRREEIGIFEIIIFIEKITAVIGTRKIFTCPNCFK